MLITLGAYYCQAHNRPDCWSAPQLQRLFALSAPNTVLVVAILHANNHRDRDHDRRYGAVTLANSLSLTASRNVLLAQIVTAFVAIVVAAVLFDALSMLVALLAAPLAIGVFKRASKNHVQGDFVEQVAGLHACVGLLIVGALVGQVLLLLPLR